MSDETAGIGRATAGRTRTDAERAAQRTPVGSEVREDAVPAGDGSRVESRTVAIAPEAAPESTPAPETGSPGSGVTVATEAPAKRKSRARKATAPGTANATIRLEVGPDGLVAPAESVEEPEATLADDEFRSALEAMLLVVDTPAPADLLAAALNDEPHRVQRVLREMSAELTARGSGIDLRFVGDGWRFYTRTEYAPYVERMLLDGSRSKLTRAALETLAVIAYRQPVTRARVSAVRGVNVDGVIRTLVARGLIAESGADSETNGTLYATTELFLERIGLASLAELPPLAPLLPGVDLIDEINESLDTDPRYTRHRKPAEADLDLGTED